MEDIMRDKLGRFMKGHIPYSKLHPETVKANKGSFKKKHIPWNKETKGICKATSGSFKKGQHPSPKTEFKKGQNLREKHWNWKKGKSKSRRYIYLLKPNHPFATKKRYVRRSRLIAEQYLKRYLTPEEIVHHINEIKDDDRLENFIVFTKDVYHRHFHRWKYYNPKYVVFDGRNYCPTG